MQRKTTSLRVASRWLVVVALLGSLLWLPFHLLTEAHDDVLTDLAHAVAQTDHHGHSHPAPDADDGGDADHHHYATDHESKFLSKRPVALLAPVLVAWLTIELVAPPTETARVLPRAEAAPPTEDFSPPSGPRAPPLA